MTPTASVMEALTAPVTSTGRNATCLLRVGTWSTHQTITAVQVLDPLSGQMHIYSAFIQNLRVYETLEFFYSREKCEMFTA